MKNQTNLLDIYSDYLMTSTSYTTATELSNLLDKEIKHDKFTQLLSKNEFSSKDLWKKVKPTVRKIESDKGVLIFDDTIEEKPYSKTNELNCYHWDHSKGRNVRGVNILNCLYNNENINIPVMYELIKKPIWFSDLKTKKEHRKSKKNKNEIFREMICSALKNKIKFSYILADIWFCSNDNMKHIKFEMKKDFIIGTKSNRLIALSKEDKIQGKFTKISELQMETDTVKKVYVKGLKFPVLLFKKIFKNKDGSKGVMYLFCSKLKLTASKLYEIYQRRWKVEEYHKSMKNNASLRKSPANTVQTQSNHIFASIYATFKFELLKMTTNLNHFAIKSKIYLKALKIAFQELQKLKKDNLKVVSCVT